MSPNQFELYLPFIQITKPKNVWKKPVETCYQEKYDMSNCLKNCVKNTLGVVWEKYIYKNMLSTKK